MTETDTEAPLYIRLFGPFDARVEGRPLPPLRSRRGQWLLALLTLRQGRPVAREWLAGTLWPDSDETLSLSNLRRTLTDLRQALGSQGEKLSNPSAHTLALETAGVCADVTLFDAALREGSETALRRAVGLYRGPLLEGCTEAWALQEREPRTLSYLDALEKLADCALERREPETALHYFRLAIGVDTLRETAQRGLMRALAASGSMAAATLAYRDFRLHLRREMNAEPDPETTALFQQLRHAAQTATKPTNISPSAPSPSLPIIPETAQETVEAPRSNLPVPLNSFVGRSEEKSQLCALLETTRLLTLAGTGGTGKTRLAVEIAREIERAGEERQDKREKIKDKRNEKKGEAADGPCWVELAALREPTLVWGALASALVIPETAGQAASETVCRALRHSSRFLILDNCEHLLDAVSDMAQTLLQACPQIQILATSREPLRIGGEIVWRVAPLSLPAPEPNRSHAPRPIITPHQDNASDLMRYEAVYLFVERARAADPRFELAETNCWTVARICRRLEGIPLALELAASRLDTLTPAQIETRLEDRFRLLRWERRDLLPRQKTLHALIDWSYTLLPPSERVLLRRLSLFAGGWSLEAAETVGADGPETESQDTAGIEHWEVFELLARLVDKSLVLFDRETGRYRMLETIREYALTPLREAGEEKTVKRRHFNYFLALTGETQSWKTGDVKAAWLDKMESEYDNFRVALQNAAASADLLALTTNLYWFWNVRGCWREGSHWLERALEAESAPSEARAKTLNQAGILAWRQGEYAQAKQRLQASIALYQESGDHEAAASALGNLGIVHYEQGEYAAARDCYEQSLAGARQTQNQSAIAAQLSNLGQVAIWEENYGEARRVMREALYLYRNLGHKRGLAITLGNLGLIALREGDYPAAIEFNEEAVLLARALAFKTTLAMSLNMLGAIYEQWRDFTRARTYYNESLEIRCEISDLRGIGNTVSCISSLLMEQGQMRAAAVLIGASDRMRQEIGAALSPAEQQDYDANTQIFRENLGEAEFERALREGSELSLEAAVARALAE